MCQCDFSLESNKAQPPVVSGHEMRTLSSGVSIPMLVLLATARPFPPITSSAADEATLLPYSRIPCRADTNYLSLGKEKELCQSHLIEITFPGKKLLIIIPFHYFSRISSKASTKRKSQPSDMAMK
jgi:hypothetical protein